MNAKEAQVARLIRLIKADGQLDTHELEVLTRMAERSGIDRDALVTMADQQGDTLPERMADRVRYFYQAMALSLADGNVAADEVKLLRRYGQQLGLDGHKVEEALARLDDEHETGLSEEQLQNLFEL
jgi:uncharacterized tellurite resistance protein B-like protein